MKKQKIFNGSYYYDKNIGKVRLINEDEVKITVNSKSNVLMVLADGMGGTKNGDFASTIAVNYLINKFKEKNGFLSLFFAKKWLISTIKKVNKRLFSYQNKVNKSELGTTLVCALIYKNKLILINVGDSRIYLYKDKKANQVFEDQTYTNYLYNSKKINKKELETHPKKHILLNALGLSSRLSYDIKVLKYSMESILLCSDGLYNSVQLKDIESILRTKDTTKEKVCSLINLANFNGGSDNISCALWEYIND